LWKLEETQEVIAAVIGTNNRTKSISRGYELPKRFEKPLMGRTSRNPRLVHVLSPSIEKLTICSPLPKMAKKYMFEDLPILKDHCPPK